MPLAGLMEPHPCDSIDVSTGRSYLARATMPEHFDTFYRGNKQANLQTGADARASKGTTNKMKAT